MAEAFRSLQQTGGRTWKERQVREIVRPSGHSSHSKRPYTIDVVQDAMDTEVRRCWDIAVLHGRRISDPGAKTILALSDEEWSRLAKCSVKTIRRAKDWITENRVWLLWEQVHGGKKRRDRGEHNSRTPTHYVIRPYPDVLADWRKLGNINGKPVCLGRNGRTGSRILTQIQIDPWFAGDRERGLAHAAAIGRARQQQAAGDVTAAPPPAPAQFEFPPKREDVRAPAEFFHALNQWLPGTGQTRAVQFMDAVQQQCGEVPVEQLVSALNTAGQRIRDMGKRPGNPQMYLLRALINQVRAGPGEPAAPDPLQAVIEAALRKKYGDST